MNQKKIGKSGWVICLSNKGYPASLERRKIYRRLTDRRAEADGWIRVIDESEEDYLYPTDFFWPIKLPPSLQRILRRLSRDR